AAAGAAAAARCLPDDDGGAFADLLVHRNGLGAQPRHDQHPDRGTPDPARHAAAPLVGAHRRGGANELGYFLGYFLSSARAALRMLARPRLPSWHPNSKMAWVSSRLSGMRIAHVRSHVVGSSMRASHSIRSGLT